IADNSRSQKNQLLAQTKNKEANYQKALNEKLRLKEEFEKELLKFESELRIAIDPTSLPPAGAGILLWPLKDIFITQKFGNTDFAQSGAYSGKGHNGIDFRASVGTEVKAALSGVVEATGNTDQYPGCYSYGKWVLIKHNNGLSTLYAHFSLIKAVAGQQVSTGDVIGYSGNTGYSTGPHLHLTVYASQGVKITRLGDIPGRPITKCSGASIPIASLNAYLNPLDYL
ncbi:MAG: M23 family metallopeptidase, partial [Candidatus Yonathbacteria bacterium]|nr:M23 family metallopeptidase [Candidatus Yonathbacteria bacterium]